ncbi:phage antirepressor KilAC domain-containing protein [Liquorilactobacillus hordei]|uniref:phage antirepressor KilAC domain-containing protein n=1 Tax=Liquorilactobacillus hordei TaxID=468911 RepID=UPI0039EC3A19
MEKDLIKVTENSGRQLVSGRELHQGLGLTTRFSKWVEQNFSEFEEGIDFTSVTGVTDMPNGGVKPIQDYALTIEMAKELSLLSRTDQGRKYRKYLISIERKYKLQSTLDSYMIENPVERAEKWIAEQKAAQDKVIKLETTIKKQAPKVAYHDQILKTQGVTYTATQIAKEYGTSASKLNNLLHELKFIYKSNGQWVLYSKFQSAGLTQSETVERNGRVFDSTRWTERGRKAMFYLLTKKGFVDEDNKIDWVRVKEIREENYKKIMEDTIMDSEELDNNMAILK